MEVAFFVSKRPYDTPEWRKRRKAVLRERGKTCEVCEQAIQGRTHIHHVYGVAADPQHRDLLVLDASCHDILEIIARRRRRRYRLKDIMRLWHVARIKLEG
jgi:hypothetical protein